VRKSGTDTKSKVLCKQDVLRLIPRILLRAPHLIPRGTPRCHPPFGTSDAAWSILIDGHGFRDFASSFKNDDEPQCCREKAIPLRGRCEGRTLTF
jgi:hypothetical protein